MEKERIQKFKDLILNEHYCEDCNELCGIGESFPLEFVAKYIIKLEKENKELKASHIITHNKVSSEEKAKLFDVIDNSIDTYLEQTKPYWEQTMTKEKMTSEEAERIIDDMYQDRNKILRKTQETETEVIFDVAKLDDVKFTNLEFASVRALREIQSLRRELKNSIPKSKAKEKIEELETKLEVFNKDIRYCKDRVELRLMNDEIYVLRRCRDLLQELLESEE